MSDLNLACTGKGCREKIHREYEAVSGRCYDLPRCGVEMCEQHVLKGSSGQMWRNQWRHLRGEGSKGGGKENGNGPPMVQIPPLRHVLPFP